MPVNPRGRRKTNGRRPLPDHLPRHEVIIPVSEEEKICPVTGSPRPFIGYEESQKLEYIPETLRVNVYKREKYGSPMGAEEIEELQGELERAREAEEERKAALRWTSSFGMASPFLLLALVLRVLALFQRHHSLDGVDVSGRQSLANERLHAGKFYVWFDECLRLVCLSCLSC